MIAPYLAAIEFHDFFTSRAIPYAIIGGIAVQFWGEPRGTKDLDLTVIVPVERENEVLAQLTGAFPARIPDAAEFARRNRLLLLRASNGVPVDVSLGLPGYDQEMLQRAQLFPLDMDHQVRVCSAEDLIIHKALAGRANDLKDLDMVVAGQRARLDTAYVRHWLTFFSDTLAMPDPLEHFEAAWRKAHPPSPQDTR